MPNGKTADSTEKRQDNMSKRQEADSKYLLKVQALGQIGILKIGLAVIGEQQV